MTESKGKVFIVEDEVIVAANLKARLLLEGYEVIGITNNGDSLFLTIKKDRPDIILMDINLRGGMDGIRAAKQVKSLYNIPVIFLTASIDDTTIQRAKISEPYGYITKPIDFKDLFNLMEIALYKNKMERELYLSELKYRTLILTATDTVLTLNEDGYIISLNPKAVDQFQHEEDELIGEHLKKILPDTFVNHFETGSKRFLNTSKSLKSEYIEIDARKKDGTTFPAEISFAQWNVDDQRYYTLIVRDITDRKKIEEDLRKAKEQLELRFEERGIEIKTLIDESPLAIRTFDSSGKLTYQNVVAKIKLSPLTAKNPEEPIDILADEYLMVYGLKNYISDLLRFGGSYSTPALFFERLDGETPEEHASVLLLRYYSLSSSDGSISQIVNIVEDLTEHYKAKEFGNELIEKKAVSSMIFQSIEDERQRISRDLHDGIGQILSAAKFNLEVYEKVNKSNDELLSKVKSNILAAGFGLKDIIYSIHPVVVDTENLSDSIGLMLSQFSRENNIKVKFEPEISGKKVSKNFHLHIYRIIQEAMNNILKHSKAGLAIISIYENELNLILQIIDNGIGFIPVPEAHRVNRSFGLLNMKGRAEIFGGNFTIDSSPGKGTTITVEFPLTKVYEKN